MKQFNYNSFSFFHLNTTVGVLALILTHSNFSAAAEKPRISVSTFKNTSGESRCGFGWWPDYLGDDFRDQLTTELDKTKKYTLLERKNLHQMHDEEFNLPNQDKATQPKKNGFKAAQYSITGAVTAFELCADGGDIGFDIGSLVGLGSLDVGVKRSNARVGLNIRIIKVETGEVIKSFQAEGKASSTKLGLSAETYEGLRLGTKAFSNTPLGEATQDALREASEKIAGII